MVKRRIWIQYCLVLLAVVGCVALRPVHRPKGKVVFQVSYYWGLYILDLDSRTMEEIDVGFPTIETGGVSYNRKSNLLVFDASEHEGIPSIYTYDLSTKEVNVLYEATSYDDMKYRPAFHPDGERVFSLNVETGVFEHNTATKQWRKVQISGTKETGFLCLSFSKTGAKVALRPASGRGFLVGELVRNEIVIQDRILDDFKRVARFSWIGDNELVFAGFKPDKRNHLWKFSLTDESLVQLTREPMHFHPSPCVSPDGKWVVFNKGGYDNYMAGKSGLWIMSMDGQVFEQLTVERPGSNGHDPKAWIP